MCFLLENNSTSTHGCCLNPYPLDNEPAGNLSAPHHCALTLIRHPHLPPANILTPRGGRAHRWLPVLKMLPDESKLVNILTRRTIVLLCCGVNRLIGFLSSVAHFIAIAMEKGTLLSVGSRPLWRRYFLPRVFPSFFNKNKCCFALVMCGGGFRIPGPQCPRNLTIIQGPHQRGRTNFGPAQTRSRQVKSLWLSTVLIAGSVRRGRGGDRCSQRRS